MDVSNPLSPQQLNALRPRPLVAEFTFVDVSPGGSVLAGTVPAGYRAVDSVVEIDVGFDAGTQITVGDAVAQARLQAIVDNDPSVAGAYETDNNEKYASDTAISVYFPAGNPTVGVGRAIIYIA